jgi:phosphoribosylaminoimidazolecarboxamide formyltransferase / IMP cyclohydrolase
MKRIQSALISVWDKEGLLPLLEKMKGLGIALYSTGGTYDYIRVSGYDATEVEKLTGYPSVFGGRVKTLHPAVMGGILFRREHSGDEEERSRYNIPAIDLVIVDLYPFREALRDGGSDEELTEKTDIGGITLIRAAAKNHRDVVVIPERSAYDILDRILDEGGVTAPETRRKLAGRAFDVTSDYDAAISRYFSAGDPTPSLKVSERSVSPLRYGENPHQKGFFCGDLNEMVVQLHGKAISYNNLLDIDAACKLIDEFGDTTLAILKHNNACGIASCSHVSLAWDAALEADPMSAFGGVIVANQMIDPSTAAKINQIFFEVIIAPGYDDQALEILCSKKNRIILQRREGRDYTTPLRSVLNGYLVQDADAAGTQYPDQRVVTRRQPDAREFADLLFANAIVKHTRSNAIVLVNRGRMIGSGTGQTSRIDAMKQAIAKAREFNLPLEGAVIASDAFFPFADNVQVAHEAGIRAIIQPGGSVRDQDSVDLCNTHDIAMVFTGIRHFKH